MRTGPASLASLVLVAAASCTSLKTAGLSVHEPPVQKQFFRRSTLYVETASLRPTLRWEPLATLASGNEADTARTVGDVTYEVRIWKESPTGTELAYQREGLRQPTHVLEEELEPVTRYLWTVRAWFLLDGKRRASEWALAGRPRETEAVPNLSCLRFETPSVLP